MGIFSLLRIRQTPSPVMACLSPASSLAVGVGEHHMQADNIHSKKLAVKLMQMLPSHVRLPLV